MVILLIIVTLVVTGCWVWTSFKYRWWKENAELHKELFENEREARLEFEAELDRVGILLNDSRATVSHMISRNARLWLGEAAGKMVH